MDPRWRRRVRERDSRRDARCFPETKYRLRPEAQTDYVDDGLKLYDPLKRDPSSSFCVKSHSRLPRLLSSHIESLQIAARSREVV